MKSSSIYTVALLATIICGTAMAESETCNTPVLETVSLYSMTTLPSDSDIGQHYQSVIERVESAAKKHEWPQFQITSQDLSVNPSSYGANRYDISVSVSFQYQASYPAITQAVQALEAYSLSFSRYPEVSCEDY